MAQIFRTHSANLFTVARKHGTRNATDAEDAVQIIFRHLLDKHADLLDEAIDAHTSSEATDKVTSYFVESSFDVDAAWSAFAKTLSPPRAERYSRFGGRRGRWPGMRRQGASLP